MSDASDTPFDPPTHDAPHERPTQVTILAIFCLLLGLFGFFGSFTDCASSVFEQLTDLNPPASSSAEVVAQRALLAKARPLTAVKLGVSGLGVLPLAFLLTGGAILLLGDRQRGARWLSWAFPYGFVLEPTRLGLQVVSVVYLRHETQAVAEAAASAGGTSTSMSGLFGHVYIAVVIATILVALAWTAVKLALYAWGQRTLRADSAQDWLTSLA